MEEKRPFYCEKVGRNCPFDSKFRYCFYEDCKHLVVKGGEWYQDEMMQNNLDKEGRG